MEVSSYCIIFAPQNHSIIRRNILRNTLQSIILQVGNKFMYSKVEGSYRSEEVKKALRLLCDAGVGDGVTVFDKDGQKIAHFPIPEDWTANVCFGGKDRNILFITASKSVYTLKMLVHGVR